MDLKFLNKIASWYAKEYPDYDVPLNADVSDLKKKLILQKIEKIIDCGREHELDKFITNLLELKMYIYGDPLNDKPGKVNFSCLTKTFHEEFMLSESIWNWIKEVVKKKSDADDLFAMELITNELEQFLKMNGIIN